MSYRYLYIIFLGWVALVASTSADIVWSGIQSQRVYHDLPTLDINQDGENDFIFNQEIDLPYETIFLEPVDGQIVGRKLSDVLTGGGVPLAPGTTIDADLDDPNNAWVSTETFLFGHGATSQGVPDYGGYFIDGNGYLGISFNIEGTAHYGWVQMSHDRDRPSPSNQYLYIHGWAWETEADTPIIAGAIPEPSSGILTMVGTLSLLQLARSRRRRKQGYKPMFRYRISKASSAPEKW